MFHQGARRTHKWEQWVRVRNLTPALMRKAEVQEPPLGHVGCLWGEQEGGVTEKHVLKGESRLKSGRTEEKRNVTEAEVDMDCGGRRLTCPLLLRVQAKLVLEKTKLVLLV